MRTLSLGLILLCSCAKQSSPPPITGKVDVSSQSGSKRGGSGMLVATENASNGIAVTGTLTGLTAGKYAVHLHAPIGCMGFSERGDDVANHVQDVGEITADASGNANVKLTITNARLAGMKPITGHCLVVYDPNPAAGSLASGIIYEGGSYGFAPH